MLSCRVPAFLLFALTAALDTDPPTSPYITISPGDPGTNVIISAPHGGETKIPGGRVRQRGCYVNGECNFDPSCTGPKIVGKCNVVLVPDYNTTLQAMAVRATILERTGLNPHFVASNLHRSHMDPNRDRMNACQGFGEAEQAYDAFHDAIRRFREVVEANVGEGILFDWHGYAKYAADDWIMVGYNIRRETFNQGGPFNASLSSIRALASRSPHSFTDLLLSPDLSLGGILDARGLKTVPSPTYPRPEMGVLGGYYRGGHITRQWGSLYGGSVDCIQIELPPTMRRSDYEMYGIEAGNAMVDWMNIHYN